MDKSEIYVLIGIGTIIGAIFLKLKKLPWWLIALGAVAGGFMAYYAFGLTLSDFILGAAAGAIGPYLISTVIEGAKALIRSKTGVSVQTTMTGGSTTTVKSQNENNPDLPTTVTVKNDKDTNHDNS